MMLLTDNVRKIRHAKTVAVVLFSFFGTMLKCNKGVYCFTCTSLKSDQSLFPYSISK